MRLFILGLIILLTNSFIHAQNSTISGYVYDLETGESIINATISINDTSKRVNTNSYGFFSLSLKSGEYNISLSADGYFNENQQLELNKSQRLDFFLTSNEVVSLQDVVVTANVQNKVNETQMGVEKLSVAKLNKIPVLLGERDVIKSIKLLPGVASSGAAQSGLSVRGGNVDQNLILLDEANVYNADHLLGFFSTINSDAVKNIDVYKGTSPAQYGGRLSSVVDVQMKEGSNKKFGVNGGLGLIFSRLNIEGPIQKETSSFLLSGRRSYADLFLNLSDEFKGNELFFYDLNAKLNYKISGRDHIFFSGYYGRDVFEIQDIFGLNWGNITQTARYNRIWNDKLFSNTSLIYSKFDYEINIKSTKPKFDILSQIEDWSIKHEFQYMPNPQHEVRIGFLTTHHANLPGGIKGLPQLVSSLDRRKSLESALYAIDDWRINGKFAINYGLRLSHYKSLNGGKYFNFQEGEIIDTISEKEAKFSYFNFEPRLSLNYQIFDNQSLKMSYTRNTQNMHLVTNSVTSSPSDRWIMSSNVVKPQISDQISIGYYRNTDQLTYDFSVEGYYKFLSNQIDLKNSSDERDLYVERQLRFGKGRAYGIEFLAKKNNGKFTGWIAYTISKTEKKINGVNNDLWYNARQDRPHDLSIVAMYDLTKKLSLSAAFVYQTGYAVTFPVGKYQIEGNTLWLYTERNGYRMPDYHRLDLSLTWKLGENPKRKSELVFGVYNAYGRENAFMITFDGSDDNPNKIVGKQISLFRYVPSISYNFKF